MKKATFFLLVVLMLTSSSCAKADTLVKSKFVFNSVRTVEDINNRLKTEDSLYLFKNGRISFLGKGMRAPAFSPGGKTIACTSSKAIVLIDEQGTQKERVQFDLYPGHVEWSPDGKKLLYCIPSVPGSIRLALEEYNLLTKKRRLVKDDDDISTSFYKYSPSGEKIMFVATHLDTDQSLRQEGVYIYDLKSELLSKVRHYGVSLMWFPDSKHIAYFTNTNEEGNQINDKFGAIFKMNTDTGKVTKLRDLNMIPFEGIKLSKDGKYFYLGKSDNKGGKVIVLWPVDDPTKEIPVTESVKVGIGYSQDYNPDWWQGE